MRERVIPSHSHSDNIFYWVTIDHVPPNIPNSSDSTRLYLFEDTAAVIQTSKKYEGQTWGTSRERTESIWIGLFERVYLDHSIFDQNTCEQQINLADLLTKGIFTTRQWHSLLTSWQLRRPYGSNDVRSFFSQTFLLSNFSKAPSDVSSDDTAREHWPDMEWKRIKSIEIRLRSGWSLGFGTIAHLWVPVYSRQEGSSCMVHYLQKAEGHLLQVAVLHLRSWENKRVVR